MSAFMGLPNFLYKYGSFKRAKGLEYLLDTIEHHRLYFASPETFNDPFDMRPGIDVDVDTAGFRDDYFRFMDHHLRDGGMYSHKQRQKLVQREYADLISGPTFRERYRAYLATAGVCCLSENPNSLLMWAHYAEGHDGYCLEFNTQLWNPREGDIIPELAEPVIYQPDYPKIDVCALLKEHVVSGKVSTDALAQAGRLAVLRKSPEWRYESEWRIVAKKPSYNTFAPRSLVRVVLGVNTSDTTQRHVTELVEKLEHKPQLYKAVLDAHSYTLNYMKL